VRDDDLFGAPLLPESRIIGEVLDFVPLRFTALELTSRFNIRQFERNPDAAQSGCSREPVVNKEFWKEYFFPCIKEWIEYSSAEKSTRQTKDITDE